ncbi:MAG: hypothetical protein A2030_01950 [Chloroflexi bacterium RBG_19FT_COMBO_50_10]|nr:MAG: hypothetical protein A2030_01950 [Chloroflexi bacterium RBG_19FT_COMBO_50_10]
MSLQNKQTELEKTRPDRLAATMLILGILIVCQIVLFSIIIYIVAGHPPPPYMLPFVFLGGIGMVYGSFRTIRGSSVTKQFVKAALTKSGSGAIAGSVTTIVLTIIAQVIAGGGYWSVQFYFITIPVPLFFGISAGGISGLILGNKWKNKKAAFVGGAIAGGITSVLYILFLVLILWGSL